MAFRAGLIRKDEAESDRPPDPLALKITWHVTSQQQSLKLNGEVKTTEGKPFLCVVLDLYSKLIVGWSMHHRQDRYMVVRAVEMAVWQRTGNQPVILHSDSGSQFTSGDYQRALKFNNLISSMSAVGNCSDNAGCEGFFGILKRERVNYRHYRTRDKARSDIFDYIERFHNPRMRRRLAKQDQQFSAILNRP
ncbi:integrase-like protein [Idiomarina loihiensis]|jgi:putative transposase|nr:integrase-like protein [Idiomarina loihiensis]TDP50025.1 integrase-like protein [Idiomarina loihiensis]TDS24623.1 integrase-like protein [Idiomarina sp. H2]|tara:strand:- start:468 stop:1043 length:576 start_codon:yes stop_codon:yes gene_type:complete